MILTYDSLFFIAFIVILVLYWFFVRPEEYEDYLLFLFTAALAFIIAVVSNLIIALAAFMTVVCISNLFKKYFYLYLATLFAILAASAYLFFDQLPHLVLAVSVAGIIGITFARNLRESLIGNERSKGQNSGIEGKRDFFQVAAGAFLILVVMFSGKYLYVLTLTITLILFGIGNLAATGKSKKVQSFFYGMERQSAMLGTGAIMIAAGTLFLVAIIPPNAILLTAIFVVLVGDSLSSLVGMRFPIATLPLHKKKSLGGFLAMILPSLLFAYLISVFTGFSIGFPIAVALIGSVVESYTYPPLDDNITVPFSIVLVFLLVFQ